MEHQFWQIQAHLTEKKKGEHFMEQEGGDEWHQEGSDYDDHQEEMSMSR